MRVLTPPALLLALKPVAASADMDVSVDILLRKRFQRFHRDIESAFATEGTLLLDTREDEDRTEVGLLSLFGPNLSRGEDTGICLEDLPTLALGAKATT
jgi:hypothetical protein